MMKVSYKLCTKNFNNLSKCYFSNSHLDLVRRRDDDYVQRVLRDNYSPEEFSNFLRVLNNHKGNSILLERFRNEIPKHINTLDDLDTRKVMSIVLNNSSLHSENELMNSLKLRFSQVRQAKGMRDDGEMKIGCNIKAQPLPIRFWIGIARLRERLYIAIRRNLNLNLK